MSQEDSKESASKGISLEKFIPVLLIVIVVLAFAVGALWQKVSSLEKTATKGTQTTATNEAQNPQVSLETIKGLFDKDVIKFGDANKKVLLVEISDPSCPYCHIASGKNPELVASSTQLAQFKTAAQGGTYVPPVPEFKKLVDDGKAAFAYIYSPGHGNGEMGTKALYCAFEAGKFWEVHDLLMSNKGYALLNDDVKNDKTKSGKLADFLTKAMDAGKMKECLDSGRYDARINSDVELATSLGVTGTPGFFVNATNFAGAYSYDQMKPLVEAALK